MNPLEILTYDLVPRMIFAQAAVDPELRGGVDADPRVGAGANSITEGADNDAGGVVAQLLNELDWLAPVLSAVGAVMFVYLVLKFIWDRRRGQQGGGGGQAGQVVGAIAGLAIFFVPGVIAIVADLIINGVIGIIDFAVGLLG